MSCFRTALAAFALVLLAGCAGGGSQSAATGAPTDPNDPYEPVNRQILDVNLALDNHVIKPVALAYRDVLGPWPRTRIRRFLQNIEEPAAFVNDVLQGRLVDAGDVAVRFAVNSTLGGAGFFDVATDLVGTPRQERDFGQTLYSWGVPDGPYLMVPILGPSNPRDFVGTVANGFLNPISWLLPLPANLGRGVVSGIDEREQNIGALEELQRSSLDFYARLRSVWRQHRSAQLGRSSAQDENPDVLEDPGANRPQGQAPGQIPQGQNQGGGITILDDPGA
jgi:phospholipid-binding lipoprotein MlaA